MSNLLDKASIVLTPTAYDNSKVLCVKPSDGSGDFDFSRNSAATRVNAQGLVEDVQIISGNKVTNGDFSNGSTGWIIEAAWTISGGVANGNGANGSNEELVQSGNLAIGKTYSITYEIKNYVSGFVSTRRPNTSVRSANGVYTEIAVSSATALIFNGVNFNGSITNIVIKEITDDTNLPRINYEGGCGSWLFEPQSTNLIPYSENFSDSSWQRNATLVITSNDAISPDGTQNATRVKKAGTGSRLGVEIALTSGSNYTLSFYMKNNGGNTSLSADFDGQAAVVPYTITNNWARYEFTFTATSTETSQIRIFTGAANIDAYIWGAQIEEQTYATSYIPTDGTQKTRNQDVCTNGGSVATISSTSGVLYAEISANSNDLSFRLLSLSDGTTSNRVYIGFGSVSNQLTASLTSGGSQQALLNHIVSDETQYNKVALKYKLNELSLFVNGSKVATDTTVTMPTLTSLQFTSGSTFSKFFGKTKAVAVWKEALTDTELQELTTI